jgi:hypothetical protein
VFPCPTQADSNPCTKKWLTNVVFRYYKFSQKFSGYPLTLCETIWPLEHKKFSLYVAENNICNCNRYLQPSKLCFSSPKLKITEIETNILAEKLINLLKNAHICRKTLRFAKRCSDLLQI